MTKLPLALLAIAVIGSSPALSNTYSKGFYAGISIDRYTVQQDSEWTYKKAREAFDNNVISVSAGYQFNSFVAVEYRHGRSTSDSNIYRNDGPGTLTVDKLNGVYLKAMYALDEIEPYVLVGKSSIKLETNAKGHNHSPYFYNESGWAYGIGVNYSTWDSIKLSIEYANILESDFDYITHKNLRFGATYRF